MRLPTTAEEWLELSNKLWEACHFPNCIGAMDGKQIAMLCFLFMHFFCPGR